MHAKTYIGVATIFVTMSISSALFMDRAFSQATACNYYASPTGTGNGLSQSSPFKISDFWPVAKPGRILCLLDGTYTGSASMIDPPDNLKGISGSPITIRALNDGKVLIKGEGSRAPIMLSLNDWFVVEGMNACCSNATVVHIAGSNNIVRRVAAWDAADTNAEIFGVHGATYNLLEDVAGWGVARKVFSLSQEGNFTTIRRAWARWEGSHVVGPKITYDFAYNNYDVTIENSIGTWSGEKMNQTYTLMDYSGQPWTGPGAGTYTGYKVDQPDGIFSNGGFYSGMDINIRGKLLGNIAYLAANGKTHPNQLILISQAKSVQINNNVAYIPPGISTTVPTVILGKSGTGGTTNLVAKNLTSSGGAGSSIDSEWQRSNIIEGSSPSSMYSGGENVFTTTRGANICYSYRDGVLTNQPLWPWPMNQRIKDAMVASGRSSVDVTATIESMFGSIPADCKSGTAAVSKPSAPINLQAQR